MIPKHQEREFKLQLAARVKRQHEQTGEDMIDILLDVYGAFKKEGLETTILGERGLWKSKAAYYQFTYDNTDDIQAICNELAQNDKETAKIEISRLIDEGGDKERGEKGRNDEMISDAALKTHEDELFILRTLRSLVRDGLKLKVTEPIEAKLRVYTKLICTGKE